MTSVIELNDLTLNVYADNGHLLYSQPAAASWHEEQFLFGHEAMATSRTHPQQFNQRYLTSMNAQPLPAGMGQAQNHADLIYQHLSQLPLPDNEDLLLSVPSHWSNDQLGLLLGICNELKLKVSGFVDLALANLVGNFAGETIHVLDLELHRLVMTTCIKRQGQISVTEHKVWEGRGYLHLVEGWMSLVADEFVQRTRFDPLYSGEAEQQLLSQIEMWIDLPHADVTAGALRASITRNNEPHDMDVQAELMLDKLTQRMMGIDPPAAVAITHRAQNIPGLTDWLYGKCDLITRLPNAAQLPGNYQHIVTAVPGDSITRLMSCADSTAPAPDNDLKTPSQPQAIVSHLLLDHVAYSLASCGATKEEGGVRFPADKFCTVNGADVQDNVVRLSIGDEVVLDGQRHTAIAIARP